MMRIAKLSLQYFLIVFGCGFILGVLRTLIIEPRFGPRWAELLEMPLMLIVMSVTAYQMFGKQRRRPNDFSGGGLLGVGAIALALLVSTELALVRILRGVSVSQYLHERDPVALSVYLLLLGAFAIMPCAVAKLRLRWQSEVSTKARTN